MRNALFPRLFLASPAVPTGARHGRSGATRSKHMSMLLSNDLSQRRPTSPPPEHILPQPPPMRWRQFEPVALCSAAYVSMIWYACLPPGNELTYRLLFHFAKAIAGLFLSSLGAVHGE